MHENHSHVWRRKEPRHAKGSAMKQTFHCNEARGIRFRVCHRPAGLTILEAMSVLTFLTTLTSLLLPAILAARESSRNQFCLERLHQISEGIDDYHDTYSRLPAGWSVEPGKSSGYGWGTTILPQLNEYELYN